MLKLMKISKSIKTKINKHVPFGISNERFILNRNSLNVDFSPGNFDTQTMSKDAKNNRKISKPHKGGFGSCEKRFPGRSPVKFSLNVGPGTYDADKV